MSSMSARKLIAAAAVLLVASAARAQDVVSATAKPPADTEMLQSQAAMFQAEARYFLLDAKRLQAELQNLQAQSEAQKGVLIEWLKAAQGRDGK